MRNTRFATHRDISIHAPAWGATFFLSTDNHEYHHFNPRSRMGSDGNRNVKKWSDLHFNPRSRMGSDKFASSAAVSTFKFQSTLPHGERPAGIAFIELLQLISIHAPAWGATRNDAVNIRVRLISIHAPAWGATFSIITSPGLLSDFNPRSRMGSDMSVTYPSRALTRFQSTLPHGERLVGIAGENFINEISIHAPAWGATERRFMKRD